MSLPYSAEFRTSPADGVLVKMRPVGIMLGGTALAAICAHVAIPLSFTPVPLTLQPFAVLLLGLLLTPRLAAGTFAAYLVEGAMGLPVFAPNAAAPGGLAHLLGPTGGYLMAYPLAAALISWLYRRTGRSLTAALVCTAAGDAFILFCGALWFSVLPHIAAAPALAVLPFLPGDALKVIGAAALAAGWLRLRRARAGAHPQ